VLCWSLATIWAAGGFLFVVRPRGVGLAVDFYTRFAVAFVLLPVGVCLWGVAAWWRSSRPAWWGLLLAASFLIVVCVRLYQTAVAR
jgi:hypothetical protein